MALTDAIHIAIPTKVRREGSTVLKIPGTGVQILESNIVENSISIISGIIDERFEASDQRVVIDQPVDSYTQAVEIIDHVHHNIHDGSHYTFTTGILDLDNGMFKEYLLVVPNTTKWPHILSSIEGALVTKIELFENTTHNTGVRYYTSNNNRNSVNEAGLLITANVGGGNSGDLIYSNSFGLDTGLGAGRVIGGGLSRNDEEWLLKQNTKYLIKVTSLTDNNNVSVHLSWYEQESIK